MGFRNWLLDIKDNFYCLHMSLYYLPVRRDGSIVNTILDELSMMVHDIKIVYIITNHFHVYQF